MATDSKLIACSLVPFCGKVDVLDDYQTNSTEELEAGGVDPPLGPVLVTLSRNSSIVVDPPGTGVTHRRASGSTRFCYLLNYASCSKQKCARESSDELTAHAHRQYCQLIHPHRNPCPIVQGNMEPTSVFVGSRETSGTITWAPR